MAHFYGTLKGSRGKATRCGTTTSGISVTAASWTGAGIAAQRRLENGGNNLQLVVVPWYGKGQMIQCYDGPSGGAFDVFNAAGKLVGTYTTREEAGSVAAGCRPSVIVPAGCFIETLI